MFRNDLDYRAISRQVEQKLAQQKRKTQVEALAVHAALFVIVCGLALAMNWLGGTAVLFILAWLVGLLFHTVATLVSLGRRDTQLREQLLQKAIQDAIVRIGQEDASKRYSGAMQLSEDGELIDFDDDYVEEEKPKRAEL